MAHIGYVAHIAHLVAQMAQVAVQYVEGDGGTCVAQMGVTVHGRTAYVHPHHPLVKRPEVLFAACKTIIYQQIALHNAGGLVVVGVAVVAVRTLGYDFAESAFVFLHVVGQGKHELLGIFGAHDYTAYNRCLGHAGRCEDKVDQELVGAVADHSQV